MIELIINNVFTEIRHASNDVEFKIWEKLSFEIQEFNSLQIPQIRHLFNRKTKLTYTGLVNYVVEILKDANEEYKIIDKRIKWKPNADYALVKYLDKERTIELQMRDYQRQVVDNCRPREIISMSTGGGKALPLDVNVLTPNGWKKMKDLHVNDEVIDEDGKIVKIIAEYPQGLKDVYEVTFSDGCSLQCCKDHLWKVKQNVIWEVNTTEDLFNMNYKSYSIPIVKPVQFKRSLPNVDDFLKRKNIMHVLQDYLLSSVEDRIKIVEELYQVSFIDEIINKELYIEDVKLIEDVKFLLQSLGFRCIIKNKILVANKEELKIQNIQKLNEKKEMKCITVSGNKHTYVCQDFIVTHNTFVMAALIAKFNVKPVSIFADKISLCTQLRNEFHKFLGEPIGLVGGGIRDVQDITVFSAQSATEELVKDTKFMLVDECLTGETLIQLSGGLQRTIKDIVEAKKPCRVLTFNIETNEREYKDVVNFYKLPIKGKRLMLILIKCETKIIRINCTDDHKFYIKNKNLYLAARELIEGYEVIIFNKREIITGTIFKAVLSFKNEEYVYDLEVADNHNFFANGVLVHNCHHLPCAMLNDISKWCSNAYYRVGVSATPWRSDNADLLIDAVCNKQRPEMQVTASELIRRNFLVPCTIYWVRQNQRASGKNYNSVYQEAIVNNEERNMNIVKIAYQMRKNKDSTILILLTRIEHGEILIRLLRKYITNKSFMVDTNSLSGRTSSIRINEIEFLSGDDAAPKRNAVLDAVRNKTCKILLGTTIFDEGLDIPSADCLILAGGGKSSTRALQRIGRVLRKHPGKERAYIYDFIDMTPMLYNQAATRKRLYKREEEFKQKDFPLHLLDFDLQRNKI